MSFFIEFGEAVIFLTIVNFLFQFFLNVVEEYIPDFQPIQRVEVVNTIEFENEIQKVEVVNDGNFQRK